MAITVNWATDQIINIPKADMTLVQLSPVEIRELDTDSFFLALKDLESSVEGMPWPNTQRNASPVLLGGITYARVLEIIDPYTITFEDGTYVVQLTGSNNNIIERTNPNQVSVQGNNAAGLIQTEEIQYSSFQGGVTIDQTNGTAGQAYPAGTRQSPVNNLTDAKFIADLRGFDKFFVKGTFTFDAADTADGYIFEGESFTRTVINLTASATIENCKFVDAALSGELDGGNDVVSCRVASLNYIDGVIYDSELEVGTITLGGAQADFIRCYSGVAGGGATQTPVIDLGGTGTSMVIRDYQGGIKLTNYTSGTDPISIDLSSGRITFDSTISAGTFTVRGVGFVEDNSTGTAVVVSQILDANSINHNLYEGAVHVDPASGVTGTEFPTGTLLKPVNNMADALVIAGNEGLSTFKLLSATTIPAVGDFSEKAFRGEISAVPLTVSAGALVDGCDYEVVQLSGQLSGTSLLRDCLIVNVTDFNGIAENCVIAGSVTCTGSSDTLFINCYSSVDVVTPPTVDFGGASGPDTVFRGYIGDVTFSNLNRANAKVSMDLASGDVIVDSTVLSGTVVVRGQGTIVNNAAAGVVEDNLLQTVDVQYSSFEDNSVWVDPASLNTGTKYPVGTVRAPVNNGADAQLIADERGLYNLTFRGNTTVTSTHSGMKFWGRSPRTTQITIDPTASLAGCEFQLCLLSGDLGSNGSSYMITVALKDVTGIFGHLENCVIREGTNTLSTPNGFAMLNKCSAVSAVNPGTDIPIFDLAGSGRVAARSLDGEIIFQNKSSGNDCSLDLDGAVVTLDSTITAGTWRFSGVGTVVDNSGGTAVIDTTDLVSPGSVADAVWDEPSTEHATADTTGLLLAETHGQIRRGVFVNTEEATNGNGYQQTPYNNWSDAVDNAEANLLQTLYLEADATVDRNLFNFEILGLDFPSIDLSGFDFKNTIIRECDVTGAQGTGNSPLLVLTCNLTNVSNFNGSGLTVTAVGSIGIADGAFALINGLVPFVGGAAVTIDMQSGAAGSNANFQNLSGEFSLTNVDDTADAVTMYFVQGRLTIDATCTAGSIIVGGNVEVIDNSGSGCTVTTTSTVSQNVSEAVGSRVIESTYTADEVMKILAAALAGKVSGAGSGTETFKGLDGTTDRIVSTVDVEGNRTAVVADGT
jgi:hypothetical protein